LVNDIIIQSWTESNRQKGKFQAIFENQKMTGMRFSISSTSLKILGRG